MDKILMKRTFIFYLLMIGLCFLNTARADPLPAKEVFKLQVKEIDPNFFAVNWKIKPGYFLYADRIHILEDNKEISLGRISFPPTLTKKDRLGNTYTIYREDLNLSVPILGHKPGVFFLNINYQGCADDGFCYPPETVRVQVNIDPSLELSRAQIIQDLGALAPNNAISKSNEIKSIFNNHNWAVTLMIFFGLGALLSLTPCVLPMVPVLSGIILGHTQISVRKAFGLSLSYVLSMAFTYSLIGIIVATLGENLQILLQSQTSIIILTMIFVVLALSMFGLFDLKLPVSWQAKLAGIHRRQESGHYASAAIMGFLSTLILSPCVTAPLVGALGFIAQTGNIFLGGAALFFMGFGMGLPLLLIGLSAGKWLPHAGPWMNSIKAFFGILLLGVAIYLISRIIPANLVLALWGALSIFVGLYIGAFTIGKTTLDKLKQAAGIIFLVYGVFLLWGSSQGGTNLLKPLVLTTQQTSLAHNTKVTSLSALNDMLNQQKSLDKPIILDFYADWCVACKVMEATTFTDPAVLAVLQKFVMIKIDITANDSNSRQLLQSYNVIAPPTFIFLNKNKEEYLDSRLVGEMGQDEFIQQLNNILMQNNKKF